MVNVTGTRGPYRSKEARAIEAAVVLAAVTEAQEQRGESDFAVIAKELGIGRAQAWSAYLRAIKLHALGKLPRVPDQGVSALDRWRRSRGGRRQPGPMSRRWCSSGHVVPRAAITAESEICTSCRLGLPVWWPEVEAPVGVAGGSGFVNAVVRGVPGQVLPLGHELPSRGELGALARAVGVATVDTETATRRVEQ